eukprot:m.38113 g.38113  ORF g.38113 m.38113 type:complete len:352 (-) comp10183_c0_seq2:1253-2308(-)
MDVQLPFSLLLLLLMTIVSLVHFCGDSHGNVFWGVSMAAIEGDKESYVGPNHFGIDPDFVVNITIFHINELNYTKGDIANMDTADVFGDLYFDLRAYVDSIACVNGSSHWIPDCTNPEIDSTNLGITEVVVEVDKRFTNYSRCNEVDGSYSCNCVPGLDCTNHVGREDVAVAHRPEVPSNFFPDFMWWRYNLAQYFGGYWYSFLQKGQCGSKSTSNGTHPCFWRVVDVRDRIRKNCSDVIIKSAVEEHNPACFQACEQPRNSSSPCWISCFFSTLMGASSSHKVYDPEESMDKSILFNAFTLPFHTTSHASHVVDVVTPLSVSQQERSMKKNALRPPHRQYQWGNIVCPSV